MVDGCRCSKFGRIIDLKESVSWARGGWRVSEEWVESFPFSLVVGVCLFSHGFFLLRIDRICVSSETPTRSHLRGWLPRTSLPSEPQAVPPAPIESGLNGVAGGATLSFLSSFSFRDRLPTPIRRFRAGGTPLTLFWLVRYLSTDVLSLGWRNLDGHDPGPEQVVDR